MGPKMLLKAVEYHRVPVGGLLYTLLADIHLTGTFLVDMLEGSGRKCELRDVIGDGRSPLQCHQELRTSQGAGNGLRGTSGKGCLLWCCLLLLWSHWCCGSGGMMGSVLHWAKSRRSLPTIHTLGRVPRGGGSQLVNFVNPGSHEVH